MVIGDFRFRLFHLKTEDEVWDYFCNKAQYVEKIDMYVCAGIYSIDTRDLYEQVLEIWKQDFVDEVKKLMTL